MDQDRLRFALVCTFYPPYHFGGDAAMVRRLAHAIARRGHQVDVIHDSDAFRMAHQGEEPKPLAEPDGVQVHRLESRIAKLSCLATQQLGRPVVHGRRIRKILDRGFDVVHFHNISLVGGPGILAYGTGVKLYTTHEHWLVCPSHVLWRHNREICTGRECIRCVAAFGRPPQLWRATGYLDRQCEHVDAFCAPSQFCANKHREFGFNRPFEILPNFLPDPPDTDHALPVNEDVPFYLFVGRLEIIKGLQDVIPAFQGPGQTELWIAGTGNYEAELRKLAAGSERVRFLGQQTPEQLQVLYRRAVAAIMPSICYEVFPMVVLEAFREGTPIIARDLGPYTEIVEHSRGGLLFSDARSLTECMNRLAGDPALRTQLGSAGRDAFRNTWCESVVMQQYFQLIRTIAKKRSLDQILAKTESYV